jgi:anti-sigma28 factor (negative regulator of flagellin synthesis)
MDIRKLTTDGFIDRKKVERFGRTTDPAAVSESRETGDATSGSDSVDISGMNAGEVAFAQQAYRNLSQQSLEKVKLIRQQILSGQYNVQEALDKATQKIASDVKNLEVISLGTDEKAPVASPLPRLTEETLLEVSRKVLRDLSNL